MGSLPAEHTQPSQLKACAASDPWACVRRAAVVVIVERTDAEALEQALGCDAVFHRVGHCDTAHNAYAAIVEGAQSIEEILYQAPGFATIEKNA